MSELTLKERMVALSRLDFGTLGSNDFSYSKLLTEALAEIERLSAELAAAKAERDDLQNRLIKISLRHLRTVESMLSLHSALTEAEGLLREWKETTLDPMDEEYHEWCDRFGKRIDALAVSEPHTERPAGEKKT